LPIATELIVVTEEEQRYGPRWLAITTTTNQAVTGLSVEVPECQKLQMTA